MKHETTINELAQYAGLFSAVDHITVPETNPDTDNTEEVTLPPPLIRRSQRRDTIVWVLTPPGIHERIFVADQATVIVYLKDIDPGRFTGHVPQQQAPAPGTWQQQQPAAPTAYPTQQQTPAAPQPAAPQRPAAPWSNQPS
ncbi:hypothetical protein OG413_45455 [Streptomyces sp. NBC_01433]|uniref:hypothetical protein n=1 Tax=Streptomyces sp. NBC_01433 TaxID=2903864 RepID=UPI00224D8B77|nr:hypothetical protein [Streptomyces sp. NBC_01433]MCX4681357.1 hypothetical protein [Streptomyces sp. NBC_01433]MCX4681705.1 hypothetical protein [Streptomyces sp. NBC_01433]MCX4682433.1 hypothetical protein [Streptomyces sp. NBC_01433]